MALMHTRSLPSLQARPHTHLEGCRHTTAPLKHSLHRPAPRPWVHTVVAQAGKDGKEPSEKKQVEQSSPFDLGPIGMTFGGGEDNGSKQAKKQQVEQSNPLDLGPIGMTFGGGDNGSSQAKDASSNGPLPDLGPIGMTFGGNGTSTSMSKEEQAEALEAARNANKSISRMTNEEWRAKYEKDGTVDLWLEEEFNAGSRLIGGRDAHYGGQFGFRTGEGPSAGAPAHKVRIRNHYADQDIEVEVPEDRYILWEAEDHGLQLPYACRMGCCTACAVRVKSGDMYQPEALGISEGLKQQGYGLMCVGYPRSDVELETVSEDEVYDLQFGEAFAMQALNPEDPESVERDDFALEVANMDE